MKLLGCRQTIEAVLLGKAGQTSPDFTFDHDYEARAAKATDYPGSGFDSDLRDSQHQGGRLPMIQGWSDNIMPPTSALLYYDLVVADQARAARRHRATALRRTGTFSKPFMVPGFSHYTTSGLEPANPLAAIVASVKSGRAPYRLAAVRRGGKSGGGTMTMRRDRRLHRVTRAGVRCTLAAVVGR